METKENKKAKTESKEPKKFEINTKYAAAAIAIIVLICGAVYFVNSSAATSVVTVGDTINVSYTGTFTNGTVFDTNVGKQQLQFTVGSGQLITGFDQAVVGMHIGENKTVTLTPSEAYGDVNSSLIVQVPSNVLGNTTMYTGMVITRRAGTAMQEGVVTAISTNTATINFNPPLAGKTLRFDIKVLSIHKSSKQ